jgi:hypothetical protein
MQSSHPHTLHDLKKWYKQSFAKAGKIIVCAELDNDMSKVMQYKQELQSLNSALREKYKMIQSVDNKQDIEIMIQHLEALQRHMSKGDTEIIHRPGQQRPVSPRKNVSTDLARYAQYSLLT